MTKYGLGILAVLLLATLGCEEQVEPGRPSRPTTRPGPPISMDSPTPFGGTSALAGTPQTVYMIHLRLGTVEVPAGIASGSEELWSHLDEEPISLRSRVLGLNGFRVGLGRADDWKDIERTLKRMTGQSFKSATIQALAGQPAPVELKSGQSTQLIFTSHEDQTLSGRHFPPGDYLLTLTCTLNEDDPSKVVITAVPQIRTTRRQPRLVEDRGVTKLVHRPITYTLTPMTFQLTVPNNDFLVIGPGIQARRPTSPGHHFLTKTRKGVPFETVVILRPMVHAVQLKTGER